jgi:hypothetical protein
VPGTYEKCQARDVWHLRFERMTPACAGRWSDMENTISPHALESLSPAGQIRPRRLDAQPGFLSYLRIINEVMGVECDQAVRLGLQRDRQDGRIVRMNESLAKDDIC